MPELKTEYETVRFLLHRQLNGNYWWGHAKEDGLTLGCISVLGSSEHFWSGLTGLSAPMLRDIASFLDQLNEVK
jgi:hypothetical protein